MKIRSISKKFVPTNAPLPKGHSLRFSWRFLTLFFISATFQTKIRDSVQIKPVEHSEGE